MQVVKHADPRGRDSGSFVELTNTKSGLLDTASGGWNISRTDKPELEDYGTCTGYTDLVIAFWQNGK